MLRDQEDGTVATTLLELKHFTKQDLGMQWAAAIQATAQVCGLCCLLLPVVGCECGCSRR